MISAFHGLNIATSALMSYQRAMDTLAQNVSNAANPNYSRQRVDFASVVPAVADMNSISKWQIGGGIEITSITRSRDSFVDAQLRLENARLGTWTSVQDSLGRAEAVFSGLSEAGISSAMDKYWNAWHDLANQPDSTAMRRQLVEAARTIGTLLNRNSEELSQERAGLNDQIGTEVTAINTIATQIAGLNEKIRMVSIEGTTPNDLMDQRDALVDTLASHTGVIIRDGGSNQVNVFLGTRALVREDNYFEIDSTADILTGDRILTWKNDGSEAVFDSGEVRGLLDARDTFIPRYQQKLNDFATELIASTNAVHSAGFGLDDSTGLDFWSGTDASDIQVNIDLIQDPQKVASSSLASTPGNNDVALEMIALRSQNVMSGATESFDGFLRSITVDLGSDLHFAETMVRHQSDLTQHLESRREQIKGVNIDEELTHMVQFQRSFQAAARMINAQDEMLDTLINRIGLVGR